MPGTYTPLAYMHQTLDMDVQHVYIAGVYAPDIAVEKLAHIAEFYTLEEGLLNKPKIIQICQELSELYLF